MSDAPRITRTIDTELEPAALWALVADGDGWAEWLVDGADIEVDPGARGTVTDDGETREVRIDGVEESHRVTFAWWPQASPDQVSTVELVVIPAARGSRLHVTETYASAAGGGVSSLAWDVRGILLAARGLAVWV